MIIDFHAHIGISKVYADQEFSFDLIIDMMDECGIDKAVLIPTASAAKTSTFVDVVRAIEQKPDRFIGFMLINPKDENPIQIMKEGVQKHGLRGVKLHPTFMAFAADDENLVYPIVKMAGELDIPVMIHSGQFPYATPWQIGLTALDNPETTIVMAHMVQLFWMLMEMFSSTSSEAQGSSMWVTVTLMSWKLLKFKLRS